MAPQGANLMFHVCHRAACDAPGCGASVMVPHKLAGAAREQLRALGWLLIRWRRPKRGEIRVRDEGRVRRGDVGGSGKILVMCPKHRSWRPKTGIELPLPAIPTYRR
jgi:hypothetical protein